MKFFALLFFAVWNERNFNDIEQTWWRPHLKPLFIPSLRRFNQLLNLNLFVNLDAYVPLISKATTSRLSTSWFSHHSLFSFKKEVRSAEHHLRQVPPHGLDTTVISLAYRSSMHTYSASLDSEREMCVLKICLWQQW